MKKDPTVVICEIGMNHMGDTAYADQYLEALNAARPDGLTFQVREKEYYAKQKPGESPFLPDDYYRAAAKRTRKSGMRFGVGLCDAAKIPFFEEIGADFYKVLSKDIGNRELVAAVLATDKPAYVSTGMSGEEDLSSFLASFGASVPPNLSLIHTQLSYEDADTNLLAIGRLQERFGVPVAFGSHSTDVNALYAALGVLPSALFFYVKGKRPIKHKDEAHAIPLSQCSAVIAEIHRLEAMMGDGIKKKMDNRIADQKHTKTNRKTALVLGSSRGVGAAIAQEFRSAGLSVPDISSKDIDTSDIESVERFVKEHPSTDVLVLNTGGPPKKDFFEITSEDWEKYHRQLFVSFATLLQRIEVRDGGYIFLISSHLIAEPTEKMILSVSYRIASWAMLKALSRRFAARQVSCINIALGPILTDRLRNLTSDLDKLQEKLPLKRAGKPEEVGKFVRSIVENDIKYLSGISINFDGGLSNSLL